MAIVTRCWTRTSNGLSWVARFSIRPASAARRAATASTSSSVLVGTSVIRLARPGAWPLRPARWSRRATPFAEPIWSTRSTGRKSTPRSSDEVATTAFRRPSLRPSSTQSRTSLSSEPWWSATTPAQSGRASRMNWYQASACERMLTKTSVVAERSISSTTGSCICLPRWPPHENRPGCAGSSVSMTRFLSIRPRTATPRSSPSSTCIASSRLPSVADRPQTTRLGIPALEARERELDLDAALAAHQLVPLVDDDGVDRRELFLRGLARQHQAQRFGRRHERGRKAAVLPGALGGRRVAGANADRPRQAELVERRLHRPRRVGGERAHRRQPQDAERRRAGAPQRHAQGGGAREGAEPDGVGLARAGGRVQQAALAGRHRRPDLALESERLPAARREPGVGKRNLLFWRLARSRRRRHQVVFRDAGLRRS